MRQVGIGVVLVLDIGFDGGSSSASGAGTYHCRGSANLFLPIDEGLHGSHKGIVADDEQVAGFIHWGVFAQTFSIVDEVVGIHGPDFRIQLHDVGAAVDDVLAVDSVAVHLNGHAVVHTQSVAHGVVGERIDHHVLSTEIAQDVGVVETHILDREESVGRIGFTVGVRHIFRIDAAREVAFRRSHFHREVGVLCIDDADAVVLAVSDEDGNGNHRQVRFACGSGAHCLRD